MDEQLLHMICDSLKPVSYDKYSYIVREGDPIDTTFFITQGIALTYTTNNNAEFLEKGHFFGEELLEWGLTQPLSNLFKLPLSSKFIRSHTKVEAFALMANDLRNIVSKTKLHLGEEQLEKALASKLHEALAAKKKKQGESSQSGLNDGDGSLPSSGTQVN